MLTFEGFLELFNSNIFKGYLNNNSKKELLNKSLNFTDKIDEKINIILDFPSIYGDTSYIILLFRNETRIKDCFIALNLLIKKDRTDLLIKIIKNYPIKKYLLNNALKLELSNIYFRIGDTRAKNILNEVLEEPTEMEDPHLIVDFISVIFKLQITFLDLKIILPIYLKKENILKYFIKYLRNLKSSKYAELILFKVHNILSQKDYDELSYKNNSEISLDNLKEIESSMNNLLKQLRIINNYTKQGINMKFTLRIIDRISNTIKQIEDKTDNK